jgi:NADPH2:quinone reductase
MKAISVEQHGGVEALHYGNVPVPRPEAGQVLVKIAYSGVNFIDVYHRIGAYKIPLPTVIGMEGGGTVEELGEGVTGFKPGDRVAYAMSRGSYAEYAAVPAKLLARVPEAIDLSQAAAIMLQGMTAHYLTHSTFPLEPGQTALVHAAAGGTGRLIVQMAKLRGARVIGTAGSPAKAELARHAGADDVILYQEQDFVTEVRRLTGGKGVDVVYDGVGQTTFLKSLDCIRPRGLLASFGQASGPVPPLDTLMLAPKGALFVTRTSLNYYISPEEIAWRSGDLFRWLAEKKLDLRIDHTYPLSDAAQAHQYLEARKSTGKLLLKI